MSITANSQRGVALLTILLLVVSITVVAGAMLASQKIVIRRSGLLFNQNQLRQDITAGEYLAMTIIRADNELNDTDSSKDIWAQPIPPYSLGTHSINVELQDEAGRFNINNLHHNGAADIVALAILQRLLTQLNIDPQVAIAILDWQDSDSKVHNDGGNESAVYSQGDGLVSDILPNRAFISIDQLLDVTGVDAEVLAALRSYITAVPYYLPINVNTASPVLLASLVEDATIEQMRVLTDMREEKVLESIDELWQLPALAALTDEQRQALISQLAVDSQAFSALITARDSDDRQRFATVLIRNTSDANVDANVDNSGNESSNNSADSNDTINTNTTNTDTTNTNEAESDSSSADKTVKIINQRLYAFRPRF